MPALRFLAVVPGDIESTILGFFASIWNAIVDFFGDIFSAIGAAFATLFDAPINAIKTSWIQFSSWTAQYGGLSPLLTVAMVAAVFLVVVVLGWLLLKLSVSEGEQTAEEAEEGV